MITERDYNIISLRESLSSTLNVGCACERQNASGAIGIAAPRVRLATA